MVVISSRFVQVIVIDMKQAVGPNAIDKEAGHDELVSFLETVMTAVLTASSRVGFVVR